MENPMDLSFFYKKFSVSNRPTLFEEVSLSSIESLLETDDLNLINRYCPCKVSKAFSFFGEKILENGEISNKSQVYVLTRRFDFVINHNHKNVIKNCHKIPK